MNEEHPIEDSEIEAIASPLGSDARLRAFIERFESRYARLSSEGYDDEAMDRHFTEVERVADSLAWRDNQGQLEQWDWAATFLQHEFFRNLYNADRHWMFEDFIREDAAKFLDDDWQECARAQMSRREVANLITVLSRFPSEDWGGPIAELQRILEE